MSEIKLVLSDIDGTIVPHGQHDPSLTVRESISDVQTSGIQLTAVTGRPYEMARELFLDVGFRGLCVFDNGSSVRDVQTGEFVWQNWLSVPRLRALASVILPKSQVIDFYPTYKQVPSREVTVDDIVVPAPYVFAFVDSGLVSSLVIELESDPNITTHVDFAPSDMPGMLSLQVTDIGSNKKHAVSELRKIVHSNKGETLAIGDGTNDLFLFENAGIKVAMGNAAEELKSVADFIVGSLSEDGFAEAMDRFVLNNPAS